VQEAFETPPSDPEGPAKTAGSCVGGSQPEPATLPITSRDILLTESQPGIALEEIVKNSTARKKMLVPLLSCLLGSCHLNAQTITPVSPETHLYRSPMILDVSVGKLADSPRLDLPSLADHLCRGIEIHESSVELVVQKYPKITVCVLRFAATLFNTSGKDKMVLVSLQLREGDSILMQSSAKPEHQSSGMKVPEGARVPIYEEVALPQTYGSPQAGLKLRVTVAVQDY